MATIRLVTVIVGLGMARLADPVRRGAGLGVITEAGEVLEVDRLNKVRTDRGRDALDNPLDVGRVHRMAGIAGELAILSTAYPPAPPPLR